MSYALAEPIVSGGITFPSYTEELTEISICGGTATYISFTVVFCADIVTLRQAYDVYVSSRSLAIGAVAAQLGAFLFDGSCPLGGKYSPILCVFLPI